MINSDRIATAMFASVLLIGGAQAADVTARIEKGRKAVLGTAVSGVVAEIPVVPGQKVKTGQVLLRLDARALRAELEAARAEAAYRQTFLSEAKLERKRLGELNERKMLSEHELALGDIALADAQRHYAAALAHVARAETAVQYSEIRAPYDATVTARRAEIGQFVQVSSTTAPLIEIGENDRMLARGEIAADQAARLTAGAPIKLTLAGKGLEGNLSELSATGVKDIWIFVVSFEPKDVTAAAGKTILVHLP